MSRFPGAKNASRQLPPAPGAAPLLSAPGMHVVSSGSPPPSSRGRDTSSHPPSSETWVN